MTEQVEIEMANPRKYRYSWRLVFRYDGERVELVDRKRVEMIAPPSIGPVPQEGRHSGTWLEIRDANDRLVFVRRLHDPFRTTAEHHSPDGKIEVVRRLPVAGEFEAIVPDIPEMNSGVLFSSALSVLKDARSTEPAREIGRFPLKGDVPQEGGRP